MDIAGLRAGFDKDGLILGVSALDDFQLCLL